MLLIPCPCCGLRAQVEFSYGGDATRKRPAADAPEREWYEYVFQRDNPRGLHDEWWQHSAGCRSWLRLRRDTLTHEIVASALPGATLADEAR